MRKEKKKEEEIYRESERERHDSLISIEHPLQI